MSQVSHLSGYWARLGTSTPFTSGVYSTEPSTTRPMAGGRGSNLLTINILELVLGLGTPVPERYQTWPSEAVNIAK